MRYTLHHRSRLTSLSIRAEIDAQTIRSLRSPTHAENALTADGQVSPSTENRLIYVGPVRSSAVTCQFVTDSISVALRCRSGKRWTSAYGQTCRSTPRRGTADKSQAPSFLEGGLACLGMSPSKHKEIAVERRQIGADRSKRH